MYTELLQQLGLAQNEARIYETLLREGELSVGAIATHSQVHRRNVYDSLNRLVEKGLVFEIIQKKESKYQAVDPHKLAELLQEKQAALDKAMPQLETLYSSTFHPEEVFIYRGTEGIKNYMRDVLRLGKDPYILGAKGQLRSDKLKGIFPSFKAELEKKNITFHNLYDHEIRETGFAGFIGDTYRFLSPAYSTSSCIAILEDRIICFSGIRIGDFDENSSFTVIVNQEIADAHKKWFDFMWEMSGK